MQTFKQFADLCFASLEFGLDNFSINNRGQRDIDSSEPSAIVMILLLPFPQLVLRPQDRRSRTGNWQRGCGNSLSFFPSFVQEGLRCVEILTQGYRTCSFEI